MKHRFSTTSDSLDLLLGPMCNTFGVLVLVACITALFSQQPVATRPGRAISATEELLQRRLHSALEEVNKLKDLMGDSTSTLTPALANKLAEIERLRDVLAALHEQTVALDKTIVQSASAVAEDPGASIGDLRQQQRARGHDIDSLTNMIAALDEQLAHLEKRKRDLLKDTTKAASSRTLTMRFPREHATDLSSTQIIVRHGKVYPLHLVDGDFSPDVAVTPSGDDGFAVHPHPSRGWEVDDDELKIKQYLAAVKGREYYFSVYVYPDSYEACRALKQMIMAAGKQFGIRALPADYPLAFGKNGKAPPKPL